eukprot:scaffold23351_cov42-Tisochrysis_lutea.AAC.2
MKKWTKTSSINDPWRLGRQSTSMIPSTSTTPPSFRMPSRRKMPDSERVVVIMLPQLVHWWRPAALMTCCGKPHSGQAPSIKLEDRYRLMSWPPMSGTKMRKRKNPLMN